MRKCWGTENGRLFFPGPQPISVEFKHFDIIRNNDYVLCEKTDGVRYMLMAFMYNDKKYVLLINRAFELFKCNLNFTKHVYNGTILDGELYEDKFLVYDCIYSLGKDLKKNNFFERIYFFENNILKNFICMKKDFIKLKLKKFFLKKDLKFFINDHLKNIEEKTDGIIFTPINEMVKIGTHETMFKWKPRDANTVDFQFKYDKGWNLYVQEKGTLIWESVIPEGVVLPEWVEEDSIIECKYMIDDVPMWWKPVLRRYDKTYPNNRRTFYRTIVNIKEDIKLQDFIEYIRT